MTELNETAMINTALKDYAAKLRRESKRRTLTGARNKDIRLQLRARAHLYEALANGRYYVPEES